MLTTWSLAIVTLCLPLSMASPAGEVVLDSALEQDDACADGSEGECSVELRQLRLHSSSQEAAVGDASVEVEDGTAVHGDRADDASVWVAATGCSGILCNGNCPITSNPTSDGGCCMSGSMGTGHKHCVKISSTNILKYACGLSASEAAGSPSCKNDAGFFSNKDKVEKCHLGGQTCTYTKYGWWSRKINIGGGNKLDKLVCTCEDVPTYRRNDDGPWALGLVETEATGDPDIPSFTLPGTEEEEDEDDDDEAAETETDSMPIYLPTSNFCCYSAAKAADYCGSCYGNAFVATGMLFHNDSKGCAVSNESCMGCSGTWCVPDPNKTILAAR